VDEDPDARPVTPEEAEVVVPTLAMRLLGPLPRPVRLVIVAVLVTALVLAPLVLVVWALGSH
jgi:hypothetical protein